MRKKNQKNFYKINNTKSAKEVALNYLQQIDLDKAIKFGLPEIDDRFDIWRVPLLAGDKTKIGEVVIDAITSLVDSTKTTTKDILENRLLGRKETIKNKKKTSCEAPKISLMGNSIAMGDSEDLLKDLPNECIDLVFTSPPYYNAKPEYAEYLSYEDYLLKMRKIIHECHRILNEALHNNLLRHAS